MSVDPRHLCCSGQCDGHEPAKPLAAFLPPAPRIAGAIDRAVVDAAAAYSTRLAELWAATLSPDPGPWDD